MIFQLMQEVGETTMSNTWHTEEQELGCTLLMTTTPEHRGLSFLLTLCLGKSVLFSMAAIETI